MRRLIKIALREYLSYVRTVGFWLSMSLLPVGLAAGIMIPGMMERTAPVRTLGVLDLTGRGLGADVVRALADQDAQSAAQAMRMAVTTAEGPAAGEAVTAAFEAGGLSAAEKTMRKVAPQVAAGYLAPTPIAVVVPLPKQIAAMTSATQAGDALRPYVDGSKTLADGGRLDIAAVIVADGAADSSGVRLDLWSQNLADRTLEQTLRGILADVVRRDRLTTAGVSAPLLHQIDEARPVVRVLSPQSAGKEVSLRDRLPTIIGFIMGMGLWSVILTGAGILLNSVVEDKSSRILEVLLASASTVEILGGKILGVAAVTATVLGVWVSIAGALLFTGAPGLATDLTAVLASKGLGFYFALYLVGGYLLYASVFAAIGAFCETTREAQAMVGPLMILLSIPVIFMGQSIKHPDAPILHILSWIPPFTPFLMVVRVAGDPPLWEVIGTGLVMAAFTALTVWLCGRAFRAGALSTTKISPKRLILALLRLKPRPA